MSRLHDVLIRDEWSTSAACAPYDPELWWVEDPNDLARKIALEVCESCPVQRDCLQHALTTPEREGIWGGKTPAQRRNIIAAAKAVA
jgi:WhiB family redox-sensing transcriptional regulator